MVTVYRVDKPSFDNADDDQKLLNKGVLLFEDYSMSAKLKCVVCGARFERWDAVSDHVCSTGHNFFDAMKMPFSEQPPWGVRQVHG